MIFDRIPPLAWVGIAIILIILIGFNYSLISLLRQGPKARPPREPSHMVRTLRKMNEVARNPFAEQESQLKELSDLVQKLEKETPPDDRRDQE